MCVWVLKWKIGLAHGTHNGTVDWRYHSKMVAIKEREKVLGVFVGGTSPNNKTIPK